MPVAGKGVSAESGSNAFRGKVLPFPLNSMNMLLNEEVYYGGDVFTVQIPLVSLRKIHFKQAVNRPIFKCFCSFKKMSTFCLKMPFPLPF